MISRQTSTYILILIIFILNSIGYSVILEKVILQFLPTGMNVRQSESYIAIVVILMFPLSILFNFLAGSYSDRFGRIKILVLLNTVGVLSYGLGWCADTLGSSVVMGLSMLCFSITTASAVVLKGLICDISKKDQRLVYFALYPVFTFVVYFFPLKTYSAAFMVSLFALLFVWPLAKPYPKSRVISVSTRFSELTFFQHLVRSLLCRRVRLFIVAYMMIYFGIILYAQIMYDLFTGYSALSYEQFYNYAAGVFLLGCLSTAVIGKCFKLFSTHAIRISLWGMVIGIIAVLCFKHTFNPVLLTIPFSFFSGIAVVSTIAKHTLSTNSRSFGISIAASTLMMQLMYGLVSLLYYGFSGGVGWLQSHIDIGPILILVTLLLLIIILRYGLRGRY